MAKLTVVIDSSDMTAKNPTASAAIPPKTIGLRTIAQHNCANEPAPRSSTTPILFIPAVLRRSPTVLETAMMATKIHFIRDSPSRFNRSQRGCFLGQKDPNTDDGNAQPAL